MRPGYRELEFQPLALGSALVRTTDLADGDDAVLALAHASSQAAIASLQLGGAARERLTHVERLDAGQPWEAAALVARPLIAEVADELRASGTIDCTVDVAIVDRSGRAVARVAFDYQLGAAV